MLPPGKSWTWKLDKETLAKKRFWNHRQNMELLLQPIFCYKSLWKPPAEPYFSNTIFCFGGRSWRGGEKQTTLSQGMEQSLPEWWACAALYYATVAVRHLWLHCFARSTCCSHWLVHGYTSPIPTLCLAGMWSPTSKTPACGLYHSSWQKKAISAW